MLGLRLRTHVALWRQDIQLSLNPSVLVRFRFRSKDPPGEDRRHAPKEGTFQRRMIASEGAAFSFPDHGPFSPALRCTLLWGQEQAESFSFAICKMVMPVPPSSGCCEEWTYKCQFCFQQSAGLLVRDRNHNPYLLSIIITTVTMIVIDHVVSLDQKVHFWSYSKDLGVQPDNMKWMKSRKSSEILEDGDTLCRLLCLPRLVKGWGHSRENPGCHIRHLGVSNLSPESQQEGRIGREESHMWCCRGIMTSWGPKMHAVAACSFLMVPYSSELFTV